MKALDPLQEVLRLKEDTEQYVLKSDETKVVLDRDGKLVRSLAQRMIARGARTYVVRTGHEIELKVKAAVRDFNHNGEAEVPFRCRISLRHMSATDRQADAETMAVEFWHRERTPWEVFQETVRLAADQWWRSEGAPQGLPLKVALYRGRRELVAAVERALASKGLQTSVIDELEDGWDAPPLPLPDLAFRVRLSDYVDREFELRLDLALEVVPVSGKPDPRHPRTHAEWSERIIDRVRKTALDCVTLACYFHDRAGLEDALKKAIDADMAPLGRRCKWLTAKTEKPAYKRNEPLDVNFTWKALHGRDVEFKARLEAAVLPEAAPTYLRHGPPDVAAWFRELLPDTTRRMLLSCDYTVLTPEYTKRLERRIEEEVSARAAEIGIKVEALVLQNQLDEWRYLEPFDVEVPPKTYDSGVADLPVRFDMSIRGVFSTLEDLKDLTFPQDKVKAEVVRVAEAAAAVVARDIAVEEYLNGWERDARQEGAIGVRERIANEVKAGLASRLKMQVVSVKPRQHDSELITYVRLFDRAKDIEFPNLRVTPHDFNVESETLGVRATIRIKGMAPPQALLLKQKNVQPSEMEEAMHQWLQAILTSTDTIQFRYALSDKEETLRQTVEEALQQKAKAFYGVDMALPLLRVLPSLLLKDLKAVIKNEATIAGVKTALSQISHSQEAGKGDLAHADEVTRTAREGEIAQLQALQDGLKNVTSRDVAEGSESADSLQEKIASLKQAAGVRASLQQVKMNVPGARHVGVERMRPADGAPPAARGNSANKDVDKPEPEGY